MFDPHGGKKRRRKDGDGVKTQEREYERGKGGTILNQS